MVPGLTTVARRNSSSTSRGARGEDPGNADEQRRQQGQLGGDHGACRPSPMDEGGRVAANDAIVSNVEGSPKRTDIPLLRGGSAAVPVDLGEEQEKLGVHDQAPPRALAHAGRDEVAERRDGRACPPAPTATAVSLTPSGYTPTSRGRPRTTGWLHRARRRRHTGAGRRARPPSGAAASRRSDASRSTARTSTTTLTVIRSPRPTVIRSWADDTGGLRHRSFRDFRSSACRGDPRPGTAMMSGHGVAKGTTAW